MADTSDVQVEAAAVEQVATDSSSADTPVITGEAEVGAAAPVDSADAESQDLEAGATPSEGAAVPAAAKEGGSDELTDEQLAALSTAELMELTHTACE